MLLLCSYIHLEIILFTLFIAVKVNRCHTLHVCTAVRAFLFKKYIPINRNREKDSYSDGQHICNYLTKEFHCCFKKCSHLHNTEPVQCKLHTEIQIPFGTF